MKLQNIDTYICDVITTRHGSCHHLVIGTQKLHNHSFRARYYGRR
jgi:hypothetical protein